MSGTASLTPDFSPDAEIRKFVEDLTPHIAAIINLSREDILKVGSAPTPSMTVGEVLSNKDLLAQRILDKQMEHSQRALLGMSEAQKEIGPAIKALNDVANKTDPGLYLEALVSFPPKPGTPSTTAVAQAVEKVLDKNNNDPKAIALRARMEQLMRDPEVAKARENVANVGKKFTRNADYISEICRTAGKPRNEKEALGATEGLKRISIAIDKKFATPAANAPEMLADFPGGSPKIIQTGMQTSVNQLKDVAQSRINSIESEYETNFGIKKPGR